MQLFHRNNPIDRTADVLKWLAIKEVSGIVAQGTCNMGKACRRLKWSSLLRLKRGVCSRSSPRLHNKNSCIHASVIQAEGTEYPPQTSPNLLSILQALHGHGGRPRRDRRFGRPGGSKAEG